ncbi:hypothetical protein QTP70_002157 [Hemibagrus guttatus]|uniref:Gypsy retrotransposon integrase-like protein 1 n=1 Tax=Hemibagrus guttatus TaxID=175788 RepID=A0AAE0UHN7_9TELE|nr:hypothetical protein QTP70_002157 [Hemibagrus guttatus]
MEKYRDGQRELHCVFVDLEKAYDRVPREELWYCMRKSGVAEKYLRVVQDMYERSRTVVRCAVGQTEEFNVEVGLHQGSALSPFLFAIVMDQLSEEVRMESPWTMMFADDIVICSESREQVEENLERWRFALERRGMKVSRSKTEYMCVNEREGSGTVRLQGEEVKKVQEFKYLGSTVQSNGECGKEVKKRVQAGWNGWRKVSGVMCDQKISARIKGKVYRTVVRPAMLYGLETVSLRKRQESELEVAELKMLRFSLGVTRLDRIRNEYIRGTAHVGHLGDKVREARLRWFGHVQRRESEYIGRRMLDMGLPGRRQRGRPKRRYMDGINEDMKLVGASVEDAEDRDRWREMITPEGKSRKKKKKRQGTYGIGDLLRFLSAEPLKLCQKIGPTPSEQPEMSTLDPFQDLVEVIRRALNSTSTPAPPATTSAFTAASPTPSAVASPMAKPAPFTGSAEDCNGFLLQCSLVLKNQSHLYPDDRSKVAFIISQLVGKALRWAESLWIRENPVVQSLSSFINHFKEVFGKPAWDSSIANALLDSGSAGNFISGALCRQLQLKTIAMLKIYQIHVVTGKPLRQVRYSFGPLQLQIGVLHTGEMQLLVLEDRRDPEVGDVFCPKEASKLPPHQPWDCAIDLIPGESVPKGRIYSLSILEEKAMEEYINVALSQGYIRPSTSPAASSFFFVAKKDGGLRPCIDYRALNKITVKFRYPLPLVPSALEHLRGATVLTKLDLRSAYNLIRIREGDEWKTAFVSPTGHYEYLVMPFGMVNASSVFQDFMHEVLREFLHKSILVYIDDILIYSRSLADHCQQVAEVLQRLRDYCLFLKAEKCTFHQPSVQFLGYIIDRSGIRMDEKKVTAVKDWPIPTSVKELQRFLGFANFYRRFIQGYSSITSSLTSLLKNKPKSLSWTPATTQAFETLKTAFTTAPLLAHPDPDLLFMVKVDASTIRVGAVLSQQQGNPRKLHPCAFFSRKLNLVPEESTDDPEPIIPEQLFVSPIAWLEEMLPEPSASTNTPLGCPQGLQYIPQARRTPLIHSTHTSLGTGHPGVNETLLLLKQRFWWPNMTSDVRRAGCSPTSTVPQSPSHSNQSSEDSFELHLVDLELEAVEKQIHDLQVKQAQLRQRKATLESSQTDAHLSQAQRTKDAARPGFVHPGAGVPRSLDAAAAEDASQAPCEDLSPSAATRLRDLDPEPLRSPLRETACNAVIIGDSIVRHVCATAAKGKVCTRCLPGARVLDVSAQVPAILKKNIGAVVLHAGMNNIRLRQTEILKKDFRNLVEKVRTTSPMTRITVSGPLPRSSEESRGSVDYLLLMNGSTVLMSCTQADLEQQSSQTSPRHYAPSDCDRCNSLD